MMGTEAASARRREPCPTCAANEREQFIHRKVMHDCEDGTVDAGSLLEALARANREVMP